jgi:CheY-like chemotaxis protein
MKKILLVDDLALNREMLAARLSKRGFEVILASNGQEALDLVSAQKPDLILMDMEMPVMDGREATRRLKADKVHQKIPVIALTSNSLPGDREMSLEAGCDDYDTKPVDFPRLLEKIQSHLRIG